MPLSGSFPDLPTGELFPQLPGRDFLHLVNGNRTIHVHCSFIRLMPEKVLNPLGRESFRFQEARNRMPEDMRIQVPSPRMGILNSRTLPHFLNDVVDQANRNCLAQIGKKHRPLFSGANEIF